MLKQCKNCSMYEISNGTCDNTESMYYAINIKEWEGCDEFTARVHRYLEKPPIGLMPKKIWILQRINSIREAIDRYQEVNYKIPIEWIDEYNELVDQIKI